MAKQGKSNGKVTSHGKPGDHTVNIDVSETRDGSKMVEQVVNVTPEVIATVRSAITACRGTDKDGKPFKATHSNIRTDVGGEKVNLVDLFLLIAETHPVFDGQKLAPNQDTSGRKLAVKLFTAGLEMAQACIARPTRGGFLFYLPEEASAAKVSSRQSGDVAAALASLTAKPAVETAA